MLSLFSLLTLSFYHDREWMNEWMNDKQWMTLHQYIWIYIQIYILICQEGWVPCFHNRGQFSLNIFIYMCVYLKWTVYIRSLTFCFCSHNFKISFIQGRSMKTFSNFSKFGDPKPVTGSHPLTASKPLVLQPGLFPVVICFVVLSPSVVLWEKERSFVSVSLCAYIYVMWREEEKGKETGRQRLTSLKASAFW